MQSLLPQQAPRGAPGVTQLPDTLSTWKRGASRSPQEHGWFSASSQMSGRVQLPAQGPLSGTVIGVLGLPKRVNSEPQQHASL